MDERQLVAIQEILERQRKALQKVIDKQCQQINEHQHEITELKSQLKNVQDYLNLFLNHPIYKLYKFFKPDQAPISALKEQEADVDALLNEGDVLFSKADLEGADEMYRAAVHHCDYSERAISGLVRLLQARGEFGEAQEIA